MKTDPGPTFLSPDAEAIGGFLETEDRTRNRRSDAAHLAALVEAHGAFTLTAAGRQILKCR